MAKVEYRWQISQELLDVYEIQKANDNGGWELATMVKTKDDNYVYYWKRPVMDSDLSKIIVSDPNHKAALKSAVQSIWFNDRSDYLTGLYEVVSRLTGMEHLDYDTVEKLYKELNPEKDH